MEEEVIFILHKFPAYRSEILKAYQTDEEFRSLCEDYYAAEQSYKYFQHKMVKDYQGEEEYREVFIDLEKEILDFLHGKKTFNC